jgi:hypothetical protein
MNSPLTNRHHRIIPTSDGLLTAAPHFMAQAMLEAFVETGRIKKSLLVAYPRAAVAAQKVQDRHIIGSGNLCRSRRLC